MHAKAWSDDAMTEIRSSMKAKQGGWMRCCITLFTGERREPRAILLHIYIALLASGSAHAKLEARTTLRYVQCGL